MKQGELCRRDSDCETGLMCAEMPGRETKSCQPPTTSNKLYSALTSIYFALSKYKTNILLDYKKVLSCKCDVLTDEECAMSSECDISRGLCCQLQRRHRQTPRKVTIFIYYFNCKA